jgi:ribosome biogenesis ATPase
MAGSSNPAVKKRVRRTNLNNAATDPQGSGSNPAEGDRSVTPRRKKPKSDRGAAPSKYAPPDLKLSSLGGLRAQITQLMEIVVLPLLHPEIYQHTGVPRPRGVLLHGVPGGGKTQLVKCLAGVSGACELC